ncbi:MULTISPECIES: substrate-binding domain-containing protein [Glycomyces]|uniref:Simple sugar transport system substrate-binding protein/D-xylose transport system substrate-binding protein n=2 Tax=Glycomyces TaxID=58113 RepID=A0A9X3PFX7_9ACTN|nr:substrate-binding domain-containing protein [Glycomyces lechevalierae]MDA1384756.1 substrate-binding domain-containing protein [Glycomyces lechevalierae]MDR7337791.1 simple sugar transport system substrate-binding protein/D-xylose transport system substrate-binding protein [Glycomyces lechevalierae]
MRRVAAGALTGLIALTALAACAEEPAANGGEGGTGAVAFLMPDLASTRYEEYDAPLFEAKMGELCADCEVIYQNADSDAALQQQQANAAIAQGAKVIVLDPVDSTAAATIVQTAQSQGVKVVAYDRPIPDKPADFYVSFDNEAIGEAIGQSLVDHLDESGAQGGLLQVNGSPTDAAAGLIRDGIHNAIDDSGYELLAEYDTPEWSPEKAQQWVSGQIAQFEGGIAGVVAANDGTGGGAIAAFKAADTTLPPVTGNDAELAAIQRIIAGDQYNTISKPIKIVAEAAAEVAYDLMQGNEPESDATLFDTPSALFEPTVVTQENLKDVIFGPEGVLTVEEVCTAEYADACAALDIA